MVTKIATSNIKRGIGYQPLAHAANRLVDRGVDIVGFQEVIGGRQKRLRKMLARKGYGLAHSWEGPIAYDLSRYKLIDHGDRYLGGYGSSGGGRGSTANPHRFANFVALKDRHTGQVTVMTNTHLGTHNTAARRVIARKQARALSKVQADLRQRFGDDANYYVTGDMNTARRLDLKLKNHNLKGRGIDRILSNRKLVGTHRMATASDHDTFIGTFHDRPAQQGGGGVHHSGSQFPGPHHGIDNQGGGKGGNHNGGNHSGDGGPKVDQGAFDLFTNLLESWGIPMGSDIEAIIKQAMIEGRTPDQIDLIIPDIQNTKTWKQRFPGWHKRVENGYNQLSVDDYLNLENSYHRIMQEAGLPAGFYDDPSDFGHWIAHNVSPDEIQNRVGLAVKTAQQIDPTARRLMAKFYGLTTGDIASYFLDQHKALPVIQRQYDAANVAAWAAQAGFDVNGMNHYEKLVDAGITAEQAAQSYGTVKSLADTAGRIASRYGDTYDQHDAENDVFFGQSDKRRKLFAQEQASFSGSSKGSTGSSQRNGY